MSHIFSDLRYDMEVSDRGTPKVLKDEDVILQSVRGILSTVTGERVRNPIGSSLVRLLFEPISNETARDIKYEINLALGTYEPRVKIQTIQVIPRHDQNFYDVNIEMTVVGINKRINFRNRLQQIAV